VDLSKPAQFKYIAAFLIERRLTISVFDVSNAWDPKVYLSKEFLRELINQAMGSFQRDLCLLPRKHLAQNKTQGRLNHFLLTGILLFLKAILKRLDMDLPIA